MLKAFYNFSKKIHRISMRAESICNSVTEIIRIPSHANKMRMLTESDVLFV